MTEQSWNFAAIEGGSQQILGSVTHLNTLIDESKAALAKCAAVWGGSGSDAFTAVTTRWNASMQDLATSGGALSNAISAAGHAMHQTETGVANMFSG